MSFSVSVNEAEAVVFLERSATGVVAGMRALVSKGGDQLKDTWKSNAAASAGSHGVHYPDSIEAHPKFGGFSFVVEVGPNPGMPQGGMSFEYGSVNQPPHLDGQKALQTVLPGIEAGLAAVASL